MPHDSAVKRLRFGDFDLDVRDGELRHTGRLVKIQPQPLRVLAVLAERAGTVVSREELRSKIWGDATFVEFDQGLNYCIRQIRVALSDEAAQPVYLETVKKRGYRFIAPTIVERDAPDIAARGVPDAVDQGVHAAPPPPSVPRFPGLRPLANVGLLLVVVAGGGWLSTRWMRAGDASPSLVRDMRPITDFADSAVAPVLSPDGHMVAFIRGGSSFLTADQIYVKMLPDGEPRQLTHDPRLKYGPAFSADGNELSYTVLEHKGWSTYVVSVLGGEPRLLLTNAGGLTWLERDRLLFGQIKSGQHMGIVMARGGNDAHELYLPDHERGMAHYAYASPDRTSAIVVEMDQYGGWARCHLISLDMKAATRTVGPAGRCRSAGWSPDGRWMYFAAEVDGQQHLWRQQLSTDRAEQLTFGPTDESGVAVDHDGRSIVTSIGVHESTLWLHDSGGDRQLSSEGRILGQGLLSADGRVLYYIRQRPSEGRLRELRRMTIGSGQSEAVFPGVSIIWFDISTDGAQAVYTTATGPGELQLWMARTDRSTPPRPIGAHDEVSPFFGPDGEIFFRYNEGNTSYLGRMNPDGSGRRKAAPGPVNEIQHVSPGRNWVTAIAPLPDNSTVGIMAVPLRGGDPVQICEIYCETVWATSGRFLFASVEEASLTSPGRALAIPVGPGETLPPFPRVGLSPMSDPGVIKGARSVNRADFIPGEDSDTYVYVQETVHHNLFRVMLP
jgi:DNA-binding winged helix-turn-helix (wHTH) protein/Tol biopolymer transport system component